AAPRSLRPDRPRAGTGPRRPRAAARPARIRGEDRSPEMLGLAEADAFHTVAGPDQQVAPFGHTDGLALDGGPTRGGDAYPAPDRVAHRPVSLEDARPQSLGRLAQHVAERRKEVGHQGGSRWLRSLEREARCRAAQLGSEVRRTLTHVHSDTDGDVHGPTTLDGGLAQDPAKLAVPDDEVVGPLAADVESG